MRYRVVLYPDNLKLLSIRLVKGNKNQRDAILDSPVYNSLGNDTDCVWCTMTFAQQPWNVWGLHGFIQHQVIVAQWCHLATQMLPDGTKPLPVPILTYFQWVLWHYNDVIMGTMASQITSLMIVYPAVYSGEDQRKDQSSTPLVFVWGIHRWPVNSRHKWAVTRKMFPFDDVIMGIPMRKLLEEFQGPLSQQWIASIQFHCSLTVTS